MRLSTHTPVTFKGESPFLHLTRCVCYVRNVTHSPLIAHLFNAMSFVTLWMGWHTTLIFEMWGWRKWLRWTLFWRKFKFLNDDRTRHSSYKWRFQLENRKKISGKNYDKKITHQISPKTIGGNCDCRKKPRACWPVTNSFCGFSDLNCSTYLARSRGVITQGSTPAFIVVDYGCRCFTTHKIQFETLSIEYNQPLTARNSDATVKTQAKCQKSTQIIDITELTLIVDPIFAKSKGITQRWKLSIYTSMSLRPPFQPHHLPCANRRNAIISAWTERIRMKNPISEKS